MTAVPTSRIDPTALPGRPCSAAAALELVGDRWSLLAVREVMFGNRRFSEIARNTGAPRDRLAARLKVLVDAGVLERRQYQQSPPRSDYHLTPAGWALAPVLQALLEWGDAWAVDSAPPITLLHHDHVLHASWTCAECGEPVHRRDVHRKMNVPGWDLAGPVAD
ncbi:winged helix-turn-helix transcriptional regulator [Jatrophihabitans sp.]|uniref:winged helix-turn-helix transcriptional regulator n=1 Tax=Jatrophihabitans sp. TaxID=1932789 RepID=UPI002C346B47|nr:helix-turn-helix domain-containing protein [Jatrophihabitans sp.]